MEIIQNIQLGTASIINQKKIKFLIIQIIFTLFGLQLHHQIYRIITIFILYMIPIIYIIIPLLIEPKWNLIFISFGIVSGISLIIKLIMFYFKTQQRNLKKLIVNILVMLIYCYLCSHKLWIFKFEQDNNIFNVKYYILTIITIFTCHFQIYGNIKQFHDTQLNQFQSKYVRIFISSLFFLIQIIDYQIKIKPYFYQRQYYFSSFIFIFWSIGLISNFSNTINFYCSIVNKYFFGDTYRCTKIRTVIAFFLYVITIAIVYILLIKKLITNRDRLIIISAVSFFSSFSFDYALMDIKNQVLQLNISKFFNLSIIIQIIIFIIQLIVIILMYPLNYQQLNKYNIILYLNFAMFIASLIGTAFNHTFFLGFIKTGIKPNYKLNYIFRFLSKITLQVGSVYHALLFLQLNPFRNYPFFNYVVFSVLIFRNIKVGSHQQLIWTYQILLFVSIFTKIQIGFYWLPLQLTYLHIISPFLNSKKTPIPIWTLFLSIPINIIITPWIWLGLPVTTIFGLPIYWPCIQVIQSKSSFHNREGSMFKTNLEQLLLINLDFGLIRAKKWIIMTRNIQKGTGYRVCDIRCLQAQQTTSCHFNEALTIDNLIEQVQKGKSKIFPDYNLILQLKDKFTISMYVTNQLSLVGIIDNKQFYGCFRQTFLDVLVYYMTDIQLQQEDFESCNKLASDRKLLCSDKQAQQIFPYQIIKEKEISDQKLYGQKKLSLKKKLQPLDYLENKKQQTFSFLNQNKQLYHHPGLYDLCLSFSQLIVGKYSGLNQQKMFKLFQSTKNIQKLYPNIKWNGKIIANKVFRTSLIISIEQFSQYKFKRITLQQIQQFSQKNFIGMPQEEGFSESLKNKKNVWSILYQQKQQRIKMIRYVFQEVDAYTFQLNKQLAQAVWNNLKWQISYARNDNDERYSNQAHQKLLRNILIQSCEQPFGYAPLYSGNILIQI